MKRSTIIAWLILSLGVLVAFPGDVNAADPLGSRNDGPAIVQGIAACLILR